jgi:hypothetical protein
MIEQGVLRAGRIRVLVLPHAIALSSVEAQKIADFASNGGVVLTDSEPGLFDSHSRRLARPRLGDLTGTGGPIVQVPELQQDAKPDRPPTLARFRQILETSAITPRFNLSAPDGALAANIDARVFSNGKVTIIGLHRDLTGAAGGKGQETVLGLNAPAYIYDLRHPGPPKYTARITLTLDSIAPALIAVAPTRLSEPILKGPARVRLGTVAKFVIARAGQATANRIIHVEAIGPEGTVIPAYTTNLAVHGANAIWRLPLSTNDPIGEWTIRIVDVLTGRTIDHKLTVLEAAALRSHRQ